jgi:hypothetical protein
MAGRKLRAGELMAGDVDAGPGGLEGLTAGNGTAKVLVGLSEKRGTCDLKLKGVIVILRF